MRRLDKKKLVGLLLFLIMGFFMVTFANPGGELKKATPVVKEEEKTSADEVVSKDNTNTTKKVIAKNNNNNNQATNNEVTEPINNRPVITLNGKDVIIRVNDKFSDAGALASDVEDGDLTSKIVTKSNVVNTKGNYVVTYNVSDSKGLNAEEVKRNVEITDATELIKSIDEGKSIIASVDKNENKPAEKLEKLIDELKNEDKNGQDIVDNHESSQKEIDSETDKVNDIIEEIKKLTFTITFVDFDETVIKTETVKFMENAEVPGDPTREGYTFTKWVGFYENVINDATVIANYNINSYLLSIKYVFADGTTAKETIERTFNYNEEYRFTSQEIPGYTYDKEIVSGNMPAKNYNVVVTYNETKLTLKYDMNLPEGIVGSSKTPEDVSFTISTPTFNLADVNSTSHDFAGWYDEAGNEVTEISKGQTKDITLKAKWTIKSKNVKIDPIDGKVNNDNPSGKHDYGTNITLPGSSYEYTLTYNYFKEDATKTSSTTNVPAELLGYCANAKTCANPIAVGTSVKVTDDVTYYAVWGNATKSIKVFKANKYSTDTTDFEFTNWLNKSDSKKYNENEEIILNTNTTLDAEYKDSVRKYNLKIYYKYEDNKSAYKTYDENIENGKDYNIQSPVIPGYTADFLTVSGVMPTKDLEKTIIYHETNLTLKYDMNLPEGIVGSSKTPEDVSFTISTPTFNLADVNSTSHDFAGWYDEAGNKVTEISNGQTKDITLKAKWTIKNKNVTIDGNLGKIIDPNPSGNHEYGSSIKLPNASRKYTLKYEYVDQNGKNTSKSSKVDAKLLGYCANAKTCANPIAVGTSVKVTDDVTYYAVWGNNTKSLTTISAQGYKTVTTDYKFVKWVDKEDGNNTYNANVQITLAGDKTLVANYSSSPRIYTLTINYSSTDNKIKATNKTENLTYNSNYSIPTKKEAGYGANLDVVSGVLVSDLTVNVIYTPNDDTAYAVDHLKVKNGVVTTYTTENLKGTTNTTATAKNISIIGYHYDEQYAGTVKTGNITGDGLLRLKLYYVVDFHNVKVDYYQTDRTEKIKSKSIAVDYGDNYNIETPDIKGYAPDKTEVKGTMGTEDVNETVTYTPNPNTQYKVIYNLEKLDGTYENKEPITLTGTTNTLTNVIAPSYSGFKKADFEQKPINGDGSTVINIYYKRNTYSLTYHIDGLTDVQKSYKYEEQVTSIENPTKKGYKFSGWSEIPATMPDHDVLVNGTFTAQTYEAKFLIDNKLCGTTKVKFGESINIPSTCVATSGYKLSKWTPTVDKMTEEGMTFNASNVAYADIKTNVSVVAKHNGNVINDSVVEYNDTITYTITIKNDGAKDATVNLKDLKLSTDLVNVNRDAKDIFSDNGKTITVKGLKTYTLTYTVTVKASAGQKLNSNISYQVDGEDATSAKEIGYNVEKTISIKKISTKSSNTVLALDLSGSMEDKLPELKEAAKSFINTMYPNDGLTSSSNLCVVSFPGYWNSSSWRYNKTELLGCTNGSRSTVDSLLDTMDKLETDDSFFGQGTPYNAAWNRISYTLTSMNNENNQEVSNVVFLSDGGSTDDDDDYLNVVQNLKDNNVNIYSIGYQTGSSVTKTLQDIATNGHYYPASTTNINETFKNIADSISSKNIRTTNGTTYLEYVDATKPIIFEINGRQVKFNNFREASNAGYFINNQVNVSKFGASANVKITYYTK